MDKLKLRVKFNAYEFEAEGSSRTVTEQFAAFRKFTIEMTDNQLPSNFMSNESPTSLPQKMHSPLPIHRPPKDDPGPTLSLHKLFTEDPLTSQLTPRVLSPGKANAEETLLLHLLGCRELKNQLEVPALQLNRVLKLIGGNQSRLDRILADALKCQWLLKSGRGKGGKYRLTTLGIQKAQTLAQDLAQLIPDPPCGE